MQNSGQYGVSDAPQYVVGRQAAPPHIFSISHDNISIAPPAAHALHAQQHHLPHHLQAQHHHYGPHPGHQPHPSLHPQQIHQTQHPQFPLPQHPQQAQQSAQDVHQQVHQQQQQAQQAREQQQAREAQQAREQQAREAQQAREQQQREQQQREQQQQREHQQREQAQQLAQQAMVQQLGLGGPDSPEVPSPGVSRPSPTKYNSQQLVVSAGAGQDDDGLEEEGRSTGGNRWPRQETLALIKIRSEMDANFRDSGLKGPLWEEVSRKLAEQGFQRSAKKCKEKFENVHKYYKKTKDGKAGRQDGKSYRFFSQLEALYGGQQASAVQLEHTDAAVAASLLTGSAVPSGRVAAGEDYNGGAQRQSEVSTEVTLSESMSEDDYDEPESGTGVAADNQEGKNSKKRKRSGASAGGSKAEFFESLMKNLVEKQEGMQQKFLEFMERREQERQARDEAWRRQEMARVAREHELRVQEQQLAATRDAALVAFLQKVTGQTLTLPQIPTPSPAVPPSIDSVVTPSDAPKPHNPSPTPATTATPNPPPVTNQLVAVATADTDPDRDSPVDPNSKRWPKPEVLTLIKLRSDMEPRFQEAGLKGPLWEEISQGMACLGYNRNQKRCKEKWENINKYFRKTKESNKKRPENAKTCPYFHQLELLYLKGVLGTPHNKSAAKAASADDKASIPHNVDHTAVPLAQRIESTANATDGDMIMKMLPLAADAAQNTAANSGNGSSGANAGHLFSSPDNGSSGGTKAHVSEKSV